MADYCKAAAAVMAVADWVAAETSVALLAREAASIVAQWLCIVSGKLKLCADMAASRRGNGEL